MDELEREVQRRYLDRLDDPTWMEEDPRLDFGPAALPFFVAAFKRVGASPGQRARLIREIWGFRVSEALPTLADALEDSYGEVWKEALDGLVTIGGQEARQILKT